MMIFLFANTYQIFIVMVGTYIQFIILIFHIEKEISKYVLTPLTEMSYIVLFIQIVYCYIILYYIVYLRIYRYNYYDSLSY